jgi:hypothetical protein
MLAVPWAANAQARLASSTKESAKDLVAAAAQNELPSANAPRFHYFEHRQTDTVHTATYQIVETDAGPLESRVAVDGKPLNPSQRHSEEEWLAKLLAHPEIQQDRQQEEERETERRKKLITVLPEAFLYQQEGTEQQGRIVRLHFRPNPDFHASSREAQVFRGMEGTLWVDTVALRFVRAEGTLFQSVSFGWGILGHLNKGGNFYVEESEVAPDVWRMTNLRLHFDGSMLIFKSIQVRVQNQSYGYRKVPEHLSLEQGVQFLRAQPPGASQN